jgi:hypothetical protein
VRRSQMVELPLRVMPVAVLHAVQAMPFFARKVQVDRVAVAEPLHSIAQDVYPNPVQSTASEPSKACRTCRESKPLSAFSKKANRKDGLDIHCKACLKADVKAAKAGALPNSKAKAVAVPKAKELEAHAEVVSTATAGLVTVESLTAEARTARSRRALYQVGRVDIEVRYYKEDDSTEYRIQGWPCYAEDVDNVLAEIHSGRGVRGLA